VVRFACTHRAHSSYIFAVAQKAEIIALYCYGNECAKWGCSARKFYSSCLSQGARLRVFAEAGIQPMEKHEVSGM
jgi:hypothetical protein